MASANSYDVLGELFGKESIGETGPPERRKWVLNLQLIGNLGGDPETKNTSSGSPMTTFRVASNRRYKTPEDELRVETEWVTVVAWGKLGESCNQYLSKGDKVYVSGRLKTNTWTGQDGKDRFNVQCIAQAIEFLSSKGAGATEAEEDDQASS